MNEMERALELLVRRRANHRCEYCHFPERFAELPFQIDHVIAEKHGGHTESDNLALACLACNSFKGPNIAGVDQVTGRITRLFHPRKDRFTHHFRWDGGMLVGMTAVARATIAVLKLNDDDAVSKRTALIAECVVFDR